MFYSAAKVTVRPEDSDEGHQKLIEEYGSKQGWAAARYCDVISYNLYKHWTPDIVDKWAEYVDKPILITEWYANPDRVAGGFLCKNTEDCGKFYQNFALRLLEAKNVVGYHYFSSLYDETMENYAKQINYNMYNLIDFFDERNR